MNGLCIIIDYCMGLYSTSIVNLDNTKIERSSSRLSRHVAYKTAKTWMDQFNLPVRVQHGTLLTLPEKRDIEYYQLKGGAK